MNPDNLKYRFFAMDKNSLFDDNNLNTLYMMPMIYTLHDFYDYLSTSIREVIYHLECFPETNGMALFDHYKVVFPSMFYFNTEETTYKFRMSNGEIFSSKDIIKAQATLDSELLKEKEIAGALLGERDGEYYFICYV